MNEPQIVRQDTPHQVTVSEGSSVAATKSLDPNGPSIRKTLAGEQPPEEKAARPAPDLPPPVASAKPATDAQVFERSVAPAGAPAQAAPAAGPSSQAAEGIVFERSLQDGDRQQGAGSDVAGSEKTQGPVTDRSTQDRYVQVPQEAPGQAPSAGGPVVENSLQDRFVAVPGGDAAAAASGGPTVGQALQDRFVQAPAGNAAADAAAQGPLVEQSLQDRFVVAPDGVPITSNVQQVPTEGVRGDNIQQVPTEGVPQPNMQKLGQAQAQDNVQHLPPEAARTPNIQHIPPEGSTPPNVQQLPPGEGQSFGEFKVEPAAPALTTAQAQRLIDETAREVQAKVEESLGAADQEWVEMDFPARVIKLKVENDKVRAKLDKLEAMARQPLR